MEVIKTIKYLKSNKSQYDLRNLFAFFQNWFQRPKIHILKHYIDETFIEERPIVLHNVLTVTRN